MKFFPNEISIELSFASKNFAYISKRNNSIKSNRTVKTKDWRIPSKKKIPYIIIDRKKFFTFDFLLSTVFFFEYKIMVFCLWIANNCAHLVSLSKLKESKLKVQLKRKKRMFKPFSYDLKSAHA